MEEVLSETHGVMVFQEQIMRILNRLGGIELSCAYACIKAISKKKTDLIDQRRIEFLRGTAERGVSPDVAVDIFDKIVFFGGYGFTKSHSAAYAYVSYQTAYLKTHYSAEFMAALLTSEIDDGNKRDIMIEHITDARRLGVEVLPPSVNLSDSEFTVRDNRILFGLSAVKGFGRSGAEEIMRARAEGGPFKNLYDLCERVDLRLVNKAAIEKLIKAGAMDCLGGNRAQLTALLPRAIQSATERQNDRRAGQMSLFEVLAAEPSAAEPSDALPDVEQWPEAEKLKYEKEVLDFYFSSHPLAQHEKELRRFTSHTAEEMKHLPADQEITLGGMFVQIALKNTQKARNGNTRYLLGRIEDMSGLAKCVMWPDDFARFKDEIKDDQPYVVKGTVDRRRDEPTLVINRILTLEQAQRELARGLWLLMRVRQHSPIDVDALAEVLRRTPGNCPVYLAVRDDGGKSAVLKLGRDLAVNPAACDRDALEAIVGPGNVKLT
jgi:DNA polymerase-3 subunit alpha